MISCNTIFAQMCEEFGAADSSEKFAASVLRSINSVVRELKIKTVLAPATVSSTTSQIDLDDDYYDIVCAGVRHFVSVSGEWGRSPKGELREDWGRAIANAQTLSMEGAYPARISGTQAAAEETE